MDISISELQSQEESETFDYKHFEAIEDSEEFAKLLVGFANLYGGTIALGFDNSGEIVGDRIDYDQTMQTITNIAYSRCSPQIRFDDEYRSLPEGDILILEVTPREDIPHAVVEKSEGTITARDYRIRTKNSTRRLTDRELSRLFSSKRRPDFTREFKVWSILSLEEIQPPGITLPSNIDTYRSVLGSLNIQGDTDIQHFLSKISQEIFPFAFLKDLGRVHFATWDTVIKDSRSRFQDSALFRPSMPPMVSSDKLEQDLNSPKDEIGNDEINIFGFESTYISEFTEVDSLLDGIEFYALPDTEFRVNFPRQKDEDNPEDYFPKYEFQIIRNGEFQFTIENYGGQWGRGFPTEHPITDVAADNKFRRLDLSEIQKNWEYSAVRNQFKTEFEFPENPDTDIQSNEKYADRLWHLIEEFYSVEHFLDTLPNTEIYKANHKLDMIINGLFD